MVWYQQCAHKIIPRDQAPDLGFIDPHDALRKYDATPVFTATELNRAVTRISRPTKSSAAKSDRPWLKQFEQEIMEEGRHNWKKMDIFKDWKETVWASDGTVRKQTKK